jgi:predicted ATPase
MVKEIKIQNYKSVQDLTLELGRINVLIGANGCGKSNILEAIAFGSAAAEDKLGNEFLFSRGIRVTDPKAMRSGFSKSSKDEQIIIDFLTKDFNSSLNFILTHDNKPFSEWQQSKEKSAYIKFDDIIKEKIKVNIPIGSKEKAFEIYMDALQERKRKIKDFKVRFPESEIGKYLEEDLISKKEMQINSIETEFVEMVLPIFSELIIKKVFQEFNTFLIYAPENTFLRKFEEESQIEPLGIRGEGLFKLLSVMSRETPEEFQEIIENLELIDWFDGFEIPKDLVFTERRIRIKDRFLEEGLQYFDQRSSNEGFLFLMFYFALFISKYTPKFFAIDNIDASLNPKLCIELIKILTKLAKKHDKQVIFTTHNPAILDGLNLNDDEVRLLVVSRNKEGHTKTKRITPTIVPEGEKPVRLSVQFMRGYIGGLPKNF